MNMIDAQHFALPSQPNVYTLCKLCMVQGLNKILIASLQRKVYCFEYLQGQRPHCGLNIPSGKEVPFTYIPNGAEIISIDAFNKSQTNNDFVIGITIIKSSDTETAQYLNIYSDWDSGNEFNLDVVAQSCLSIELDFIPYQLYHTNIRLCDGTKELVWLLSGSDEQVHVYREDKGNHRYQSCISKEIFPEFSDIPSVVLWMNILELQNNRRLTVIACECGFLRVSLVGTETNQVIDKWQIQHSGPITSACFFTVHTSYPMPDFLRERLMSSDYSEDDPDEEIHLLITNSLKPSCVYHNVLNNGLGSREVLAGSDQFDVVLCSLVDDTDMDGRNEILLGTYGQELLSYSWSPSSPHWSLCWQRNFANPIVSLAYLDIIGDAVNEFVVLTTKGLQILQHDTEDTSQLLTKKIRQLCDILGKETEVEKDIEENVFDECTAEIKDEIADTLC